MVSVIPDFVAMWIEHNTELENLNTIFVMNRNVALLGSDFYLFVWIRLNLLWENVSFEPCVRWAAWPHTSLRFRFNCFSFIRIRLQSNGYVCCLMRACVRTKTAGIRIYLSKNERERRHSGQRMWHSFRVRLGTAHTIRIVYKRKILALLCSVSVYRRCDDETDENKHSSDK